MVCDETPHHPLGEQHKAYIILPYKLSTTKDQLTSRAGLLLPAQLMDTLSFAQHIDRYFPQPQSNRGFKPSVFVQTLILMQHDESFHLDDVRHLKEDNALRTVLDLKNLPSATAIGDWLRRTGKHQTIYTAWEEVNKLLLKSALHNCKQITLDIDATEIIASKANAKWTYKSNQGYMPMVGHVAQTGQVVACDFREGNQSPNSENLEFIIQCQNALPDEYSVQHLRIDAAGYQIKILKHCDDNGIFYTIRAVMSAVIKEAINTTTEADWQPMLNKKGEAIKGQDTFRTVHCIGDYEKPFTLIIQRKHIKGQAELELDASQNSEEVISKGYIYRAIATNQDALTDSQIIHWYNQRGEDSENRIKELKLDFGGDTLPCSDKDANALYLNIVALSYNLFALMRALLPEELAQHRVITIRWRLYAIAAKVVKTGRQLFVKVSRRHRNLLAEVLSALRGFEPPII
jgi:hypothetical protein